MVYKFWDKNASINEELTQELRQPVIKKFKRRKVSTRLRYDVWAGDLPEMGSLFSNNQGVKYLLCDRYMLGREIC